MWNVARRRAEVGGPAGGLGGGPSAGDGGRTSLEGSRGADDVGHVQLHEEPPGLARCGRAQVASRSSCGSYSSYRDTGLQALPGVVVPKSLLALVVAPTPLIGTPVSMYGSLSL